MNHAVTLMTHDELDRLPRDARAEAQRRFMAGETPVVVATNAFGMGIDKADVRYVPSSENRSHGASLGARLEPFCNGTRFRYVFR